MASPGITKDSKRMEEILQEPYQYITQVPGKDVRSKLIHAFNKWLRIPEEKLSIIKEVTKILHNASLLIDDIEDNSQLRRGIPVAHNVFGIAQTINCANYMYFKCMEQVAAFKDPEATRAFTEQLIELHRGQGLDIYWRDSLICPTEEEYRDMVKQKTGGLFVLAVRLMQLYSDNKSDFVPLLDTLGLYFQIRDDYANLSSDEYTANKSFCEDLTEGKFSFPIIHSIHSTPRDHQVLNILKKRTEDVNLKRHCLDCLRKTNSFEYTRIELNRLAKMALDEIERLGGNPELTGIVLKLCDLHGFKPAEAGASEETRAGAESTPSPQSPARSDGEN